MLLAYATNGQVETTYLEEWYASDGSQIEATDRVVSQPDIDGNLYVSGTTLNQYGKQDLLLTKYNATGDEIWSETYNLADTNSNVIVGAIIMNGDNDLYVTGTVYNGATQNYDVLTVKYDSSGVFKWHKLYDGTGSIYDGGADVMYDQYNRIFVTGSTTSGLGDQDMLTICYSTSGTQLWAKTYDSYSLTDVGARIDNYTFAGQVHIRGFSQKTDSSWVVTYITYNSSSGNVVGTPSESADVYIDEIRDVTIDDSQNIMYFTGISDDQGNGKDFMVVKVNSGMGISWTRYYDGVDHLDDIAQGIIVDKNNDKVYVTGFTKTSTGGRDLVVLKYTSSGTLEWSETYDGAAGQDDEGLDIKVDDSGQVVVAGYSTEKDTKDYYTLILDSDGDEVWSASFNGLENRDDQVKNLLLDGSGNITLVGHTGTKDGKTTYTTVRYKKKDLFIPPDNEAVSSGISYCENKGQLIKTDTTAAPEIKFSCTGQSPALYFQDDKVSFVLARVDTSASTQDTMYRVDMTFNKSKGNERIYGLSEREDYHNYYLGHIPTGREKVRLYDRLVQTDVFEDIDFQYYSNGGGVKYYFVCQPGANPKDIEMVFDGQQSLSVNGNGDLIIGTSLEDIILPQPSVSQFTANGTETTLGWTPTYSVVNDTVKLSVGSFDSGKYLVFKVKEIPSTPNAAPDWVTYFGGSGGFIEDDLYSLYLDANDDLYVTGFTGNTEFPEVEGNMIFTSGNLGFSDGLLVKFDDEVAIQYLTIFGGCGVEISRDLVKSGNYLFLAGESESNDFPATIGSGNAQDYDGFISSFNSSNGALVDARLIGGAEFDSFRSLDVYGSEIYLVGVSKSTDFPVQSSGSSYFQENNASISDRRDGVILQLDESLEIDWSSYFGGELDEIPDEIIVDPSTGKFYLLGITTTRFYSSQSCTTPKDGGFPSCTPSSASQFSFANGDPSSNLDDLFLAEFDSNSSLIWTTFLGGSGQDQISFSGETNIAINPANTNEISIIGATEDFSTFPSNPGGGFFQNINRGIFIATFKERELDWLSGIGSFFTDEFVFLGEAIAYNANGSLIALGSTNFPPQSSMNFCSAPTTQVFPICPPSNPGIFFQTDSNDDPILQGGRDAFLAGFSTNRDLLYSTYFGGDREDLIRASQFSNNEDQIFFVGRTSSLNEFPIRIPNNVPNPFVQEELVGNRDGFIARLSIGNILTATNYVNTDRTETLVFPNPASTSISIHGEINRHDKFIEIYNFSGQLMKTVPILYDQSSQNIDIRNFPAGVYLIKMGDQNSTFIKI